MTEKESYRRNWYLVMRLMVPFLSDFAKSLPDRHKDFPEAHFKNTYHITVFRSAQTGCVKIKAEHVRTE